MGDHREFLVLEVRVTSAICARGVIGKVRVRELHLESSNSGGARLRRVASVACRSAGQSGLLARIWPAGLSASAPPMLHCVIRNR